MSQFSAKKVILGSLATLMFLGSLGIIGWVMTTELKKDRNSAAENPSVRDLGQLSGKSKLSVSPVLTESAMLETKADAEKTLDAMDLSVADLDTDIE